MEKLTDDYKKNYLDGLSNRLIRIWFYIKQGMGILNEFRNLFVIILGTCWTFKQDFPILKNIGFIAFLLMISIIILLIIGYVCTHYVNKVIDFLNIQFSTHWGRYGYSLQEEQNKILNEINKKLNKDKNGKI